MTASPCRKRLAQQYPASAVHPNFISGTSRKVAMICRRLENMVTHLESMTPRWPYGLCHSIAVPSYHSSLRQPFKYRKDQCRWLLAPFARAHESRINPKGCKKLKADLFMYSDKVKSGAVLMSGVLRGQTIKEVFVRYGHV